jgi:hypothetical protein
MSLELTGKITEILPLETGEGKNGPWKKQHFVIEFMDGNYAKKLCLSLWGDKTSALSDVQPGTDVKVSFNVESREWNQRWYTDARAWRIEPVGQSASGSSATGETSGAPDPIFNEESADDNDLPF